MPNTTFDPSWKKHEKGVHSEDTKTQIKETDKFLAERDHELARNPQAKRWEESRVKAWAKDKPQWAKKRLKAEEAEINQFNAGLRVGGQFNQLLHPVPGYLIVEIDKPVEKTAAGIYMPTEASKEMQNVGTVIDIGEATKDLNPPCFPGDKVMFKKGAGLELGIEGRDCRFMVFQDVLGTFYE